MRTILLACSLFFAALTVTGQTIPATPLTQAQQKNNYIMSTGNAAYVPAMLLTAEALKAEDQHAFGDVQIVIYGQAVKQFADPDKGTELLKVAREAGVKLVLCELAMQAFNIDKSQLPEGLYYVGNAFKHALDLQKQGYYSLSL